MSGRISFLPRFFQDTCEVHNRDAATRAFDLHRNIHQAVPIKITERNEWIQGGGKCESLIEAYYAQSAVGPKRDTSERTR